MLVTRITWESYELFQVDSIRIQHIRTMVESVFLAAKHTSVERNSQHVVLAPEEVHGPRRPMRTARRTSEHNAVVNAVKLHHDTNDI